jgi:hypothetical protein
VLAMSVTAPQTIHNKGRIWLSGNYLLVNEDKKGIHVFDNTNPSSPQALYFISIPGNMNMAVKDGVLLADNQSDLLSIDFSNPAHPALLKRTPDVFKGFNTVGDQILVGYSKELVSRVTEEDCNKRDKGEPRPFDSDNGGGLNNTNSGGNSPPNIGGSMSRFAIVGDYLYIVSNSSIKPVKVSDPGAPEVFADRYIVSGVETVFPFKGNLFIGSQTGMYIYSLSTPDDPKYLSKFTHARSCDPVVVEGNYAYVTLRGGNKCGGYTNQLDVIDVKDLANISLVKSYPMTSPNGLGIENGKLFVCDGSDGLKVYDATDPEAIDKHQLGRYPGLGTYDVIPYHNKLIMISDDGIYQYDYTDASNLKLLSTIPIVK